MEHLDQHQKGMMILTGLVMLSFAPSTWTEGFPEFWRGDALLNQQNWRRRITIEELASHEQSYVA